MEEVGLDAEGEEGGEVGAEEVAGRTGRSREGFRRRRRLGRPREVVEEDTEEVIVEREEEKLAVVEARIGEDERALVLEEESVVELEDLARHRLRARRLS